MPRRRRRDASADYTALHRELRRKGVTLQLGKNTLKRTPASGRTATRSSAKDWAKSIKRSMRQQHRAGEKLFADFAGPTVPVLASGVEFEAHVFVAVLGASNYTRARDAHRDDGGLDRQPVRCARVHWRRARAARARKALIARPDRYEPGLGTTTQDFVNHYGTAMLPARPRKPQDKAKVEVGVQIVERWVLARLRHYRFYSLAELNKAIAEIADLNQRPFKRLEGNRREWFERLDQPVLRPLPVRRYEIATFQKCRVNIDYHVDVGGHYSVPHSLARQEVWARITRHGVEILHGGKRVARTLAPQRQTHDHRRTHAGCASRAHGMDAWAPAQLGRIRRPRRRGCRAASADQQTSPRDGLSRLSRSSLARASTANTASRPHASVH